MGFTCNLASQNKHPVYVMFVTFQIVKIKDVKSKEKKMGLRHA